MIKSKQERYKELVEKFKEFRFTDSEICNPYELKELPYFNMNHLNPWNIWHENLDAEIMLIGQDFSNVSYFKELYTANWKREINSPTNKTLSDLFNVLGFDIGLPDPNSKKNDGLYFVNCVLGLKSGDMDATIKDEWYESTANDYLAQVIEIVNPKYIISMGEKAYKTICFIKKENPSKFLKIVEENNGFSEYFGSKLFFVCHCGQKALNLSRGIELQKKDWLKIKNSIHL